MQTKKQTDRQADKETNKQTGRQTYRWIKRQTDRKTEETIKGAGWQTRQTDSYNIHDQYNPLHQP